MRPIIIYGAVVIWLVHIAIGAGAGYAAIRLWYARSQKFIRWLGLFLTGYVVEVTSAIVLLFVARKVVFTLKFSAVLFGFMFVADMLRAGLIVYIIRGPEHDSLTRETSGAKEPDFWRQEFREAVRDVLTEFGLIKK